MTEEKHTWDIIILILVFLTEVWSLEMDVTGNLQVDIMTGIVLDTLYISVYDHLF